MAREGFLDRAAGRPLATVAVLGTIIGAANVWWIAAHRSVGMLEIDEQTYLQTGFDIGAALRRGSPSAALDVVLHRPNGPLLPTLSGLLLAVFPVGLPTAFAAQQVVAVATAVLAAAIARRLADEHAAIPVGLAVLGLHAVVVEGRTYQLGAAVAGSAALLCWSLVTSDDGRLRSRMALAGLATALLALSRTVAIAYVPTAVLCTIWTARRTPEARRNLLVYAIAATPAIPWWWVNHEPVFDDLVSDGYGATSGYWAGPQANLLLRLPFRFGSLVNGGRLISLVLLVALVVTARRAVRVPTAPGSAVLAIMALGSTAALLSTENVGTFFDLSTLVLVVVLATVRILARSSESGVRRLRTGLAAIGAASVLLSMTDTGGGADATDPLSVARVLLPGHAHDYQHHLFEEDPLVASTDVRARHRRADAWAALNGAVLAEVVRTDCTGAIPPTILMGDAPSHLLGGASLQLLASMEGLGPLPMGGAGEASAVPAEARVVVIDHPAARQRPEAAETDVAALLADLRAAGHRTSLERPLPTAGQVSVLAPAGPARSCPDDADPERAPGG